MVNKTRSAAIKKAWKSRKPKGTCPFCHKSIWARGVKRNGKLWHNECYDRSQIVKVRKGTATRGFYK